LNPRPVDERPTNNHLSHGTALETKINLIIIQGLFVPYSKHTPSWL
jgi:hypothetical protein